MQYARQAKLKKKQKIFQQKNKGASLLLQRVNLIHAHAKKVGLLPRQPVF